MRTHVHKRADRAFLSSAIEPELKQALVERARREERSLSYVIRRAVRRELVATSEKER